LRGNGCITACYCHLPRAGMPFFLPAVAGRSLAYAKLAEHSVQDFFGNLLAIDFAKS